MHSLKVILLYFVIGLFILSDIFVENVLVNVDGATLNDYATSKGTVIQMAILCTIVIILTTMESHNIV